MVIQDRYKASNKIVMGVSVLPKEQKERLHPFKVVLGSLERDTQVFDSDSHLGLWETKPCRPIVRGNLSPTTGCASCNGRVYITKEFSREILVYDFENARWSSVDAPGGSAYSKFDVYDHHLYRKDTLGAWNSHILDVVDEAVSSSLSLWELDDETKEWRVFDRMPTHLYRVWLKSYDGANRMGDLDMEDLTIHASYCGDYVLVFSWAFMFERAYRYCLFNTATKLWQQLEVNTDKIPFIITRGHRDWIPDWHRWDSD